MSDRETVRATIGKRFSIQLDDALCQCDVRFKGVQNF